MDKNQKILIVDDDENLLASVKRLLRSTAFDVEIATNGQHAFSAAKQQPPDIILSDWMMPVMNGVELCQAIKSDPITRKCYFVFLTARHDVEDKVDGLTLGADAYLAKPFHRGELFATLKAASRICALQKELEHANLELNNSLSRISNEMLAAQSVQQALLPQSFPKNPKVAFAAKYKPATECSGDYYDVFELSHNRLGLAIVDVCGHGLSAMVGMGIIRTLMHQMARQFDEAGDLLTSLNQKLHNSTPTGLFATAIYCIYETDTGHLNYASAGHHSALVMGQNSNPVDRLEVIPNFPLNVIADVKYSSYEHNLPLSSTLMLYTDGLIEAMNPNHEMYGEGRMIEQLSIDSQATADEIVMVLMQGLEAFIQDEILSDDITLLLMTRIR